MRFPNAKDYYGFACSFFWGQWQISPLMFGIGSRVVGITIWRASHPNDPIRRKTNWYMLSIGLNRHTKEFTVSLKNGQYFKVIQLGRKHAH